MKYEWELKLSDADGKLEALLPELEEPEQTIIGEIRKLFSAILLVPLLIKGKRCLHLWLPSISSMLMTINCLKQ